VPQGCCRRVPSRVRRVPPVVGRFDRGGRDTRSSRGVAAICATIAVSRAAALSHATAACATAAVSAAAAPILTTPRRAAASSPTAICATIAVSRADALTLSAAVCATAAVSAAAFVPGGSFHPPLRAVAASRSCPIDVQELLPLLRGDEVCLASVWSMCRLPGY